MMRLTIVIIAAGSVACSSSATGSPTSIDVPCVSEQTCAEYWCPELCEAIGKVVISVCDTRYTEDSEPGDCNCVCETERGGRACFQYGVRGAAFTGERITTETECNLGPGGREFCEPVCEAECDFGFGALDASCEFNRFSTLNCECVCGQCQFLG